jgi:hypothetical protein
MKVQKCIVVEIEQFLLLQQKYRNGFNFSQWIRERIIEEVGKEVEIPKADAEAYLKGVMENEEAKCLKGLEQVTVQECGLCNVENCRARLHKFQY